MILQEKISVVLNPANIQHYKSLGYSIPSNIGKGNISIEVKVYDLPKTSSVKILCRCDICQKERLIRYMDYRNLCHKCSHGTIECRQKISMNHADVSGDKNPFHYIHFSGSKNHRYNSTLTKEERFLNKNRTLIIGYKTAMNQAKKRDCKCLICGSQKRLQGHHILGYQQYPELRCNIDNIVTLCFEHHIAANGKSIHNIYGRNPTIENFYEFKTLYQ